jgi:hypothetical protein
MMNRRILMAIFLFIPACLAREQVQDPGPGGEAKAGPAETAPEHFAGLWRTTYGPMRLEVNGSAVSGTYSDQDNGRIAGTVKGPRIEFTYSETGETGEGWFELLPGGVSFRGRWRETGGTDWKKWNGRRRLPGAPPRNRGRQEDFRLVKSAPPTGTRARTRADWEPERTWVMMVAVEVFEHNDTYADMPDPNREDQKLHDLFVKCGIPEKQIVYLKDQKATLQNVKREFIRLLKKTGEGDTLFTYYTGHGVVDKLGLGYFVNYDAPVSPARDGWDGLWAVADMYELIERHFKGDTVLAMAGCCYSGALGEEMRTLVTDKAYATLSSSLSTQTSGMYWTFTETLISGFLGRPYVDANADGTVSLREVMAHSREEVAVFMQQEATFSTNGHFPGTFNLVKSQKRTHADVGRYYEARINPKKGAWQKTKAVRIEGDEITLLYYFDDEANYKTFKRDSRDVRTFSRACFEMGDVVDVKDGRWYPAEIVAIEKETGLHKVRYGKRRKWEGLFFHDDLRMRP